MDICENGWHPIWDIKCCLNCRAVDHPKELNGVHWNFRWLEEGPPKTEVIDTNGCDRMWPSHWKKTQWPGVISAGGSFPDQTSWHEYNYRTPQNITTGMFSNPRSFAGRKVAILYLPKKYKYPHTSTLAQGMGKATFQSWYLSIVTLVTSAGRWQWGHLLHNFKNLI